jgi:pimeloyl-ACP methyl ester carboxylesterase
VIVGHDWGAPVARHAALMRPDRFRGVIGLSVPYRPRESVRLISVMLQTDDAVFYQLYFQNPGVAEAECESDIGGFVRSSLYSQETARLASPRPSWCPANAAYSRAGARIS